MAIKNVTINQKLSYLSGQSLVLDCEGMGLPLIAESCFDIAVGDSIWFPSSDRVTFREIPLPVESSSSIRVSLNSRICCLTLAENIWQFFMGMTHIPGFAAHLTNACSLQMWHTWDINRLSYGLRLMPRSITAIKSYSTKHYFSCTKCIQYWYCHQCFHLASSVAPCRTCMQSWTFMGV